MNLEQLLINAIQTKPMTTIDIVQTVAKARPKLPAGYASKALSNLLEQGHVSVVPTPKNGNGHVYFGLNHEQTL